MASLLVREVVDDGVAELEKLVRRDCMQVRNEHLLDHRLATALNLGAQFRELLFTILCASFVGGDRGLDFRSFVFLQQFDVADLIPQRVEFPFTLDAGFV